MATTQDVEKTKARIKKHMTSHHQRNMAHYLRHYAVLPATHPDVVAFSTLSLADVSVDGLTIVAASGQSYEVPFDPPLTSLAEARLRLVEMDAHCRKALGLPPADTLEHSHSHDAVASTVTKYDRPEGSDFIILAGLLVYLASLASLPLVVPGSAYYRLLDVVWGPGGGASGFAWLVRTLVLPVIGLHLGESVYLHFSRMKRYGVQTGSRLWWTWEASCFLEGMCAFRRVDEQATKNANKEGKTL